MTRLLHVGESAPWFHAAALEGSPRYAFDTAAGRWTLMLFAGHAGRPAAQAALQLVQANRDLFDDVQACFFGVTVDPADAEQGRIAQLIPGIRWFLDYDRKISRAYGALDGEGDRASYQPHWLALDPMHRVCLRAPLANGAEIMARFRILADTRWHLPAPVLMIPNVLPSETCQLLIDLYESEGGQESGFMREVDGVTRMLLDPAHKRRRDYAITEGALVNTLKLRLLNGLNPMLKRAFQFEPTRVERFIVACYDGDSGGHFRPHRDNTTKGTAHRRFAVTINLDTNRYDGGDLCFPEFGPQTYRAPTGGAVVFSCSLLHEARPVTRGKRYAFLPFLYDDEAARLRERNLSFVTPELQGYTSGLPPTEA